MQKNRLLTQEIKEYISSCVLCWLATSSDTNVPNVSPKEIFTYDGDNRLLIANIASPNSVRNIKVNAQVCVSFVDVFKQKGFQLHGSARVIDRSQVKYQSLLKPLRALAGEKFPILSIIAIDITATKPILAPSYLLNPSTSEADQIKSAKIRYGL